MIERDELNLDQELCPPGHIPGSILWSWTPERLADAITDMRARMRAAIATGHCKPDLLQALSGTLVLMISVQKMQGGG